MLGDKISGQSGPRYIEVASHSSVFFSLLASSASNYRSISSPTSPSINTTPIISMQSPIKKSNQKPGAKPLFSDAKMIKSCFLTSNATFIVFDQVAYGSFVIQSLMCVKC